MTPSSPPLLHGLSILVVDDEPDARELVGYLLTAAGAITHLADSAENARQVLATHTPDAIISDIAMPQEDGYSLMQSIRAMQAEDKRGIPSIALTAHARTTDRQRALAAGFTRHVAKPVQPSALVQAVLELVTARGAGSAAAADTPGQT